MLNEYEVREVWGSPGAPVLGRVRARNANAAVVRWLRANGYEAREGKPGSDVAYVTSDDAPALQTRRVA